MCDRDCMCLLGIVISIFLGLIVGVLFFFGLIPGIRIAVWIGLGIALFALTNLITLSVFGNTKATKCVCCYGGCLLTGIIGTIILAIIGLSVFLPAGTILTAILVAVGAFFLSLLLISIIVFIKCLIEANCRCRE